MQADSSRLQSSVPFLGEAARLAAALLVLILVACSPSPNEPRLDRTTLADAEFILSDTLRTEMITTPDAADRLGLSEYAGADSQGRLSDQSQAGFERTRLLRLDLLRQLSRRPVLPNNHPLARDLQTVADAYLRLSRLQSIGHGRLSPRTALPYAVDPFSGIWVEGPDLLRRIHRVETLNDAQAYVRRLAALADALDDIRRRLLADAETGLIPPRFLLERLGSRLQALTDPTSLTLPGLAEDLENLILGVPEISLQDQDILLRSAKKIIRDDLRPAYGRLISTVDELQHTAPLTAGIWAQGQQTDIFRLFFDWHVGSSPFETHALHELQTAEVARQRETLQSDLTAMQRASGQDLPENAFDAALTLALEQAGDLEASLFEGSPFTSQSSLAEDIVDLTGVRLEPEAADQSRPTLLLINASQLNKWPRAHQQLFLSSDFHAPAARIAPAIIDHATGSPARLMLKLSGFEQGWISDSHAQIAASMTAGDRRLIWQHWRLIEAGLAAADTGLHSERWSAEETQAYLMNQAALDPDLAADAVALIAAKPGFYSARFDGARRLKTLRIRAKATLGPAYLEEDFKNVLLGDGPRPFSMVEADIEAWYEAQLNSSFD